MTRGHLFEHIGDTPLVRVAGHGAGIHAEVLAKIESCNPTGSVKDRVAAAMVHAAEEAGALRRGTTIVEGSSGNTGVAVARIAAVRGYRAVIVTPDSVSAVKVRRMRAFGAEVVQTPALFGTRRAYAVAQQIAQQIRDSFVPDQANNPANPAVHAETTGPEIWESTSGRVDVLVAGVGTGGTLSGVGKYLRSRRPDVEIVAVEPEGSAVLSGGTPGPHRLTGIGAGYIPDVLDRQLISRVETVTDAEAEDTRRELACETGVHGGPSSGAAAHVALRLARDERYHGRVIVTVFADSDD
jgi:cysteine synthase A